MAPIFIINVPRVPAIVNDHPEPHAFQGEHFLDRYGEAGGGTNSSGSKNA